MENKKFNLKTRYLTNGINSEMPFEIQLLLWGMIEENNDSELDMDYLQVFEFKSDESRLTIIHSQENPEYKKTHQVKMDPLYQSLVDKKVYVIDDQTHSTMLFASEY